MQSKFPVSILQRSGAVEVVYEMSSSTAGFNGPTLLTSNGFIGSWLPNRNGWGYDVDGKAYWAQIGNTNVLEIYSNSSTGWQISGSWTLQALQAPVDGDYIATDTHSRKNWLWCTPLSGATIIPHVYDIAADVLAQQGWTGPTPLDTHHFSFALTDQLQGALHYVYVSATVGTYVGQMPDIGAVGGPTTLTANASFPTIVSDNNQRLWSFYWVGDLLEYSIKDADLNDEDWLNNVIVYQATQAFTGQYSVCHRPEDDTIHIALIEYDQEFVDPGFPDEPFLLSTARLKYFRRTPNEWTEVLLETWSGSDIDGYLEQLNFVTPQITSSPTGIMVYNHEVASGSLVSNVKYYFLDTDGYDDPVTSGSWASGTMMSGTGSLVGIVAPRNWPV